MAGGGKDFADPVRDTDAQGYSWKKASPSPQPEISAKYDKNAIIEPTCMWPALMRRPPRPDRRDAGEVDHQRGDRAPSSYIPTTGRDVWSATTHD